MLIKNFFSRLGVAVAFGCGWALVGDVCAEVVEKKRATAKNTAADDVLRPVGQLIFIAILD
jgi:hypothetical protein